MAEEIIVPEPEASRERLEELKPIAEKLIKELRQQLKQFDAKDRLALSQMLRWRIEDLWEQIDRKWERECYRPYVKALKLRQKQENQPTPLPDNS